MTARAAAIAVCLVAGCRPAAAAQAKEDPPTIAWKMAVRSHVPGKADAAVEAAAQIPYWRVPYALRRTEVAEDRFLLTRALILHTDLAILQRRAADQRSSERAQFGSVRLEDGQSIGRRQGSPHWDVALQIAVMLANRTDADARRTALSWFRTVNALHLHWAEGTLLYADTGLRYYPDDPVLHLSRGTVHQLYANGRVQQFVNAPRRPQLGAPPGAPPGTPETQPVELARAEIDLRRAVTLDPTLAEARIRLAHVVGDLGRPQEAIPLVEEALRARLPAFFQSYATLILGRNLARVGRVAEAHAAFDRAAALAPAAQAPRVGQSQAALVAGRPADALAGLTAFMTNENGGDGSAEEWALYFRVHDPAAADQLAALRAEVP